MVQTPLTVSSDQISGDQTKTGQYLGQLVVAVPNKSGNQDVADKLLTVAINPTNTNHIYSGYLICA
jgi:hypothetical protein